MDSKKKQAQASLEYIIIVGILLVMLIPLFYYAITTTSERVQRAQAEDTVYSVAKAVDEVYALGAGTKKYVWVAIPGGVEQVSINGTELSLTIHVSGGTSDITATTQAIIAGSIPFDKGTYHLAIEHLASGIVQIGASNDSTPPSITWLAPQGATCNPITLRVNTNEPALCRFDGTDQSYVNLTTLMEGNTLGHNYYQGVQEEGNYNYYVRCSDIFGNQMTSSFSINYSINFTSCGEGEDDSGNGTIINDSIAPLVSLLSPASDYISNSSQVVFFYNVTDESAILLCRLLADNVIVATVTDPLKNIPQNITGNLEYGTYQWAVNCTDTSGNQGNSSMRTIVVNATLDDDFPLITLLSPINGSIRNFNLIQFFYTVVDNTSDISSCTLSVSGALDDGGMSSFGVTDSSVVEGSQQSLSLSLEQGNHTWSISCIDNSIYQNTNVSVLWNVRVNSTTEQAFITSCAGQCGYQGYSDGVCRQEPPKCTQNYEVYSALGNQYCTGGSQSDTCCCVP